MEDLPGPPYCSDLQSAVRPAIATKRNCPRPRGTPHWGSLSYVYGNARIFTSNSKRFAEAYAGKRADCSEDQRLSVAPTLQQHP